MTLVEQASKIIEQKGHTQEDITELCKIRRRMSKLYSERVTHTAIEEEQYEQARVEWYVKFKQKAKEEDKKLTENEATRLSKRNAEKQYGSFRTWKAKGQGFRQMIEAINSFIINYYKMNHSIEDAIKSKV